MALYTGKGDKGTTKLFDSKSGERVTKTSDIFEALGTLDELNAVLGLAKVACPNDMAICGQPASDIVHTIQDHIFTIQAEMAGADKHIPQKNVTDIETLIADIEEELPEITTFFVPGGSELAARFELTRTAARRAERRLLAVHEAGAREVNEHTRTYINRLSSLLYALARLANHEDNIEETPPQYRDI